jgi:type IV pilus assembly protein PilW
MRKDARVKNQKGFSLVELMVAVLIGMVLIAAVSTIMVRQDSLRRSVTGTNDVALATGYVSYMLDREMRSAGSGFAQTRLETFGCSLHVARNGAQILPRTAAWPTPLENLPLDMPLAPVIVHAGAGKGGSDILVVMAGASGTGEIASTIRTNSVTTNSLRLINTLGLKESDLVLVGQAGMPCMVQQVSKGFAGGAQQTLDFGQEYAASTIAGQALTDYSKSGAGRLAVLGDTVGARPRFQAFGRHDNDQLVVLDLLRIDGNDVPQVLSDGILDLRVIYGVDTNDDGVVNDWVAPTGAFSAASLMAGTAAAREAMSNILAVRIGLIVRGDLIEREAVSAASVTLFSSTPALQIKRDLTSDEQRLRVRGYEFSIPLRNNILFRRTS